MATELISAEEVKELQQKHVEEQSEKDIRDYIRNLAFMVPLDKPSDDLPTMTCRYFEIAKSMGFKVENNCIRFDEFVEPHSNAQKILEDVYAFRDDIIKCINSNIEKCIKESTEMKKVFSFTIDFSQFFDKYNVNMVDDYEYSFDWLENIITDKGYHCRFVSYVDKENKMQCDMMLVIY
jgi:hypothetical protein